MAGTGAIRWRCGCKSWEACESPAKACQKVQHWEDEAARLRAVADAAAAFIDSIGSFAYYRSGQWQAGEWERGQVLAADCGRVAMGDGEGAARGEGQG